MPDPPRRATAPEVVATATGALADPLADPLADRILARAQASGVPVREDTAVAEVLAWAYALDRAGRSS